MLTESQLTRYAHHIILKDVGGEGQRRLLASRVLIIGAGGLGSPAAFYLAAAGVGTLGIVDDDRISLSNLQRQILHRTCDIGMSKVQSAHERLHDLNPDCQVIPHDLRLTRENARAIAAEYELIIDASDNFQTKYLINDVALELKLPFSHAGVAGFRGQLFTATPGGPCLRCVFPEPPPEGQVQHCRGAGVIGATAGVFGSIQAAEAIKALLNCEEQSHAKLLSIDLMTLQFTTLNVQPVGNCRCRTL